MDPWEVLRWVGAHARTSAPATRVSASRGSHSPAPHRTIKSPPRSGLALGQRPTAPARASPTAQGESAAMDSPSRRRKRIRKGKVGGCAARREDMVCKDGGVWC